MLAWQQYRRPSQLIARLQMVQQAQAEVPSIGEPLFLRFQPRDRPLECLDLPSLLSPPLPTQIEIRTPPPIRFQIPRHHQAEFHLVIHRFQHRKKMLVARIPRES